MKFETLKRVQDAIVRIRSGELDSLDCGRHEWSNGVFVTVSSYQTKESGMYEAHRKYIDIQYILDGSERIDVADVEKMRITQDYAEDKDLVFGEAEGTPYYLNAGQYLVLYPEEAHRPGMKAGSVGTVKKAVIKVPV